MGTRGFMAPEVVLSYNYQTTSIDIWSAGVIFLGFLMKRSNVLNLNNTSKIKSDDLKDIFILVIIFGKKKVVELIIFYHQ